MNPKSFVIAIVTLILITPIGLGAFNHYIGSWLLSTPHGLLGDDLPLESRMYLAKNYKGQTYLLNIRDGLEKTTFTTNSLGFRVPEVDFAKKIILMSGDSILFGLGLNDWETVPYLLQRKAEFNSQFSFVNAGISGKSMAHHLLTLTNLVALSKKKHFKIKYLMMWISFNDFEEDISPQVISNRALKKDLPLKDRLALRFPPLAIFYKTLRDGTIGGPVISIFNSLFIRNKSHRYEKSRQDEPDQTLRFFSGSDVVEKNLIHYRELIEICDARGITLINVITPYGYNDIFYEKGFSEYLDELLMKLGQKHIIKLKDVYHSHPEIYPYISKKGYDFHHFSYKAAQLIADELGEYLLNLETY
jgi:hypothetical protein